MAAGIPVNDGLRDAARRLVVEEGMPVLRVAKQLGIPEGTIRNWKRAEGWPSRPNPHKGPLGALLDRTAKKKPADRAETRPPITPGVEEPKLDMNLVDTLPLDQVATLLVRFALKQLALRPSTASLGMILNAGISILKGLDAPPSANETREVADRIEARLSEIESAARPAPVPHDQGEIPTASKEDAV